MNLLGILVVLAVMLIAVNQQEKINKTKTEIFDKVKQEKITPTKTPAITPTVKKAVITTITITPTVEKQETSQNSSSFQYPNSTFVSSQNSTTEYESNDSPSDITNWFKDEIKKMGMNATSFVMTNTNGNVLNKLAASNGQREVKVEIRKDSNQSSTKIIVQY